MTYKKSKYSDFLFIFVWSLVAFLVGTDLFDSNWLIVNSLRELDLKASLEKINSSIVLFEFIRVIYCLFIILILFLSSFLLGDYIVSLSEKTESVGCIYRLSIGIIFQAILIFIMGSIFEFNSDIFRILCLLPLIRIFYVKQKNVFIANSEIKQIYNKRYSLLVFSGFIFILLFSGTYPIDYDVLEYHLGAPKEYWFNHRITFLPHNVYANMPSLSSMLNLFLIAFNCGDAAKLLQSSFIFIMAMFIFKRVRNITEAIILLYFILSPEIILTSYTARNEPMIMYFFLLALYTIIYSRHPAKYILTGLFMGACFCIKYSSAVIVFPACLFALYLSERTISLKKVSVIFIACFIVASPWLIRNFAVSFNPTYPFLSGFYGHFFELKFLPSHQFENMHFSGNFTSKDFTDATKTLFTGLDSSKLFTIIFPLVFLIRKKRILFRLLGVFTVGLLCWYLFTHRVERFFLPFLSVQVIIMILTLRFLKNNYIKIIFVSILIMHVILNISVSGYLLFKNPVLDIFSNEKGKSVFLQKYDPGYYIYEYFLDNKITPKKVLYIGESRTYYRFWKTAYNTPYNTPVYEKYFNNNELDLNLLNNDEIDYIFINTSELQRTWEKAERILDLNKEEIIQEIKNKCKLTASFENNRLLLFYVKT